MAACVMVDKDHWLGIHYMASPTIIMQGNNAVIDGSGVIALGATSWTVKDGAGVTVGTGTMLSSVTQITVCSSGTFVGGGAIVPGYYTVYTNSGTNGVVAGAFVVCTASSNLYVPTAAGDSTINLSAWLGGAADRDFYAYQGSGLTAAQIISNRGSDQYFIGPQDAARPRKLWLSPQAQANSPTQDPTSAQWGTLAAALVTAGYAGAYYECPTNEPENGGWSNAAIITYWNACAAAILAADSTAHVMGYDSGGIYNNSSTTDVANFLAGATHTVSAFTNHMENSNQNLGDIVMLREYFGGVKAQFASSGVPNLDLWLTETGIVDGYHFVLMPRRAARQRTVLRFAAESFGFAKENCYDFPVIDHQGSGLPSFLVDWYNPNSSGNLRAGAYALHVQSEALFGTRCDPTHIPTKLSFGATGSVGDSLFAGLHYTATAHDVIVIATNGIESDTVTLNVSSSSGVVCWDGWGAPRSVTVSGSQITFAVDDLLTYLFLPNGVTVSVVDTGSNVITKLNSATNLVLSPVSLVDESSSDITGVVNNGSFSENNAGVTGVSSPYTDATVPSKLKATITSAIVGGVAIKTAGPPWQGAGCSLTAFTLKATVGGVSSTVFSYSCASAESFAIPSPSNGNSSDICSRTSWWTGPFAWIVPLSLAGAATVVEVDIASTDMTGQPDVAAANVGPYGTAMETQIAEFQVFQGTAGGSSTGASGLLIRFGMG